MPESNIDATKALIISVVFVLVVSGSLIIYYNTKISGMNKNFDTKISVLEEKAADNLEQLKQSLAAELGSLKDNLTSEIQVIDTDLRNFKKQNEDEINTLSSLIDEIEEQSEIQLGELKDELKTIKVESNDFTAIIDDVLQSVVSVGTDRGLGSGAIVDEMGFIVTNFHVVDGAKIIRVLTYDEDVYNAALIGYNDDADVAVLKVDAGLESLRFGDSDDVAVGERVIALGSPAGLSFTVTEGIVSAVHRKGPNDLQIYLQTDVPINPGNSGGPLVNANSRIIGINNFKIEGFEGLGFAIESNTVKEIADDVIERYLEQAS
ncbi:trypsin-like peptidase domain-containing protein [Candidatus Woesearchaeota archaeon]|nr:trypsin-like peptidase domain-containing protein [Candidatus Woesearchaeota archaeon]